MNTIDSRLLAIIIGGSHGPKLTKRPDHRSNPARLTMSAGCPAPTNANRAKADAWVKGHPMKQSDIGGWNDPIFGKNAGLFTYEHFNRMPCAPGEEF